MPYLNLDPNYFEHHKTKRLVAFLGPHTDVLPLRLWAYCAKFHPVDGRLQRYSSEEIEAIIDWKGKPEAAIKALVKSGFILVSRRSYQCADWAEHQGHLAAFSRRGKAANKVRWAKVQAGIPVGVHKRTSGTPPALPIRTIPNQEQITAANGSPSAADLSKLADSKHVKHALKKSDRDLLEIQLPFSFGDIPKGRRVIDIDHVSAQQIMDKTPRLGLQLRCALLARINLKKAESI